MSFDAIVIGAGHNGLVAATVLAKAGRKVVIVESQAAAGGAAKSVEFHPGFRVSHVAHIVNRLHGDVIRELDLKRHGLKLGASELPTVLLSETADPIVLRGAYGEMIDGRLAEGELKAWLALRAQLFKHASVLKRFFDRAPPPLAKPDLSDRWRLVSTGIALRLLGKAEMREFLRMILMCVHDVADEHLSDDRLKGFLALDATLGVHLGPRSPTSLLGLYYRLLGDLDGQSGGQSIPLGGMASVIAAMEKSCRAAGVDIQTGKRVCKIIIEKGRAVGVLLSDGTVFHVPIVMSAISPATTMIDLVGPRNLDTGFVRAIRNIRMKGTASKLHLALDRIPQFKGANAADAGGRMIIAPSSHYVDNSFNPSKYGELPVAPAMEITLPSLAEPAMAPEGRCTLSAIIQHTPYDLKQGWDSGRDVLLETSLDLLERHAPGIRKSVTAAELLTPPDIERLYDMPGGHWHHGELRADQMAMMRPTYAASRYATPVAGLYLCSAGSHPGGGVSGMPGLLAARIVLKGAGA